MGGLSCSPAAGHAWLACLNVIIALTPAAFEQATVDDSPNIATIASAAVMGASRDKRTQSA